MISGRQMVFVYTQHLKIEKIFHSIGYRLVVPMKVCYQHQDTWYCQFAVFYSNIVHKKFKTG